MTQRIRLYVFIAVLTLAPLGMVASSATSTLKSKTQPKEMVLNQGSTSKSTFGAKAVPFNHETHSLKLYSANRKAVIGCAECHHTDAPKGTLKGELTTIDGRKVTFTSSERDVILTTKILEDANAAPVKGCRECHARAGATPTGWPKMPVLPNLPDEEPALLPIDNEVAYHDNCNTCHNQTKALDKKTKAPTECAQCHSGIK